MKRSQGICDSLACERMRTGIRTVAPVVLVLGIARPSVAQDLPPTRLEYRVPDHCPTIGEFSERVRRRSSRIQLVTEGSGLRTLVVEVKEERESLKSSVRIVEIDGTERTRHLNAKDCNEAIDGLALIATVSLDPEAMLQDPTPTEPEPPPEPPPKPPPPKPVEKKADKPTPRVVPKTPKARPVRFGVGLQYSVLGEVVPRWISGGALLGWAEYRTGSFVSPLLRATFAYIPSQIEQAEPFGVAHFETSFTLAADACAFRLGTESIGAWLPCLSLVGGRLLARGEHTDAPEHHEHWFGALGPSALFMLRLWEPVEIVADVRAGAALNRNRFRFSPSEEFYQIPPVTFSGGLGLAVGFP